MAEDRSETFPGGKPGKFSDERESMPDVDQIHLAIVRRERMEPEEGFEKTPWWVWSASVVLLFMMGYYLGRYGGSCAPIAHQTEEPVAGEVPLVQRVVRGDLVFTGVCQACHQSTGLGMGAQYPPLAGSEWLVQDPETPVRIVLRGLSGEIRVKNVLYNNTMPAFGDRLSDAEIAAVLTHERSSWGNAASAVSVTLVDTLRRQTEGRSSWTAQELAGLRQKLPLMKK